MPTHELSGTTALVTGASRGFGRAIAVALSKHGAHVGGVARDPGRLEELHQQLGGTFTPVAADAADPVLAGQLLDKYRPRALVLNAGAATRDAAGRAVHRSARPHRATPGALARPKLGP
jgi:NADP-dependent 3-hydroxy acid dehydrogenase YdfG